MSSALATCPKNITLTVANPACGTPVSSALTGFVNVFNKSAAGISPPASLCLVSKAYTFSNTSTNNCVGGDVYIWKSPDSTIGWTTSKGPVTITFSSYGSKTVKLVDSNACGTDSVTATIFINRPPLSGFTANPLQGCQPLVVNFTDTTVGLNITHAWNFGDPSSGALNTSALTNPVHTFNNPGTFTVSLTASNSCVPNSVSTKTIRVFARPVASIGGVSSGCVPHSVNLTNTTPNLSPGAKILWDFGGGDTTSLNTPATRVFNTPGSYPVKLKITDTCGTDSATVVINVSTIPTASFTATTVCRGDSTAFTNTSVLAPGDVITSSKWWFGNGDSSSATNPKKLYATAGNYQVIQKITTDKTCTNSDTMMVTVKVSPIVNFTDTPANICDGNVVVFHGIATTSSGTISSYQWTFGTNDTARVNDTTYRFPSPGTYPVNFKIFNSIGCFAISSGTLTVNPVPDSKFSASNPCFGQFTRFYDSSTVTSGNTVNQWAWDFNNDGLTDSITQNPSFVFPSSGSFKIKLRVGTNNNCFNTDSITINVNPLPVVSILSNAGSLCKLDSFIFNNTTTGAVNYLWRFGDTTANFNTSSTASFKKVYTDTGLFVVKMIAFTPSGCRDSAGLNLTSRPFPVALFTTNDTISCAPKIFTFTNQSILANTYQWFVGNTRTSNLFNRPDTTVSMSAQIIPISLVATNIYGCRPDTARKNISTISNPVPNFSLSADSGCGPFFVNFNNTSFNANSYHWFFGNGKDTILANPSMTFIASQNIDSVYSVKLVATNSPGCKDSISKPVKVFPKPVSAFAQSVQNGCGPLPVSFTNNSIHKSSGTINDMTFHWNFGNGITDFSRNPSLSFIASKTIDTIYTVQLISFSKYGCSDTSIRNVQVFPNAKAVFSANQSSGCGPLSVNFTNSSIPNDTGTISIMNFNWNFANGITTNAVNPSAVFYANATKDTIYHVRLIAFSEHGCPDTAYTNIQVYPKPLSSFTTSDTAGCGPLNISFTNHSLPYDTGGISIMSFIWSLGNGFNSINVNPSAQYSAKILADTIYHISLVAFSEHNCLDTSYKNITVHPKPIIGFNTNKTQGCGPLVVSFTNSTLLGSTYKWRFGDNDSSSATNTSHTYESFDLDDSVYTVSLSSLSYYECASDTATSTITSRYNPIADFISSADSVCGTSTVSFYNSSSGIIGNNWNFGNGFSSAAINPLATFTALPDRDTTYFVSLIVRSPYNCRDTITKPVKVNALPNASFVNISPGCSPLNITFNNTSSRAVKHEWDFGDGTSDSVMDPSKNFVNGLALVNRIFPVTLKVYSSSGCTDTAKQNILVYPRSAGGFSANKVQRCDTTAFNFVNNSVGANNFTWKFGDNSTDTSFSPIHYYHTAANKDTTFQVSLISTTINGCKDTTSHSIIIKPLVHANFTSGNTSSCARLTVQFNNLSVNSSGFLWMFGDGTGSVLVNPSHQYNSTGAYKITLIAFDSSGCSDTSEKSNFVNVYDVPIANFLANPQPTSLPNAILQFMNISTVNGGSLTFNWNFGDPASSLNSSSVINPSHLFSDSGNYEVQLIATSNFNCIDTFISMVRIGPHVPVASFNYNPANGCVPHTVYFSNNSRYSDSYSWNFGDASNSTDKDPVHTFTLPGTYNVFLRAEGPGGIKDTTQLQIIHVYPLPKANFIASPLTLYMPASTVNLTNTSYDNAKNLWLLFRNPQTVPFWSDSNANTSFHFLEEGNYSIRLIVKSQFGCLDSASSTEAIIVNSGSTFFVPSGFTPNGDNINDIFHPAFTGVVPDNYSMRIYDRWGMLLFQTNNISEGWDGKVLGAPAITEVYIWIVEGQSIDGSKFSKAGQVTLIR
ncbi:MAG: PKD domain-containing protein [Bacteroidia bacterium]